jgi:hypothetical protein
MDDKVSDVEMSDGDADASDSGEDDSAVWWCKDDVLKNNDY